MKQEGPVRGREQVLTAHGPSECAWWEKKEEGDGARGRSVSLSGKVLGGRCRGRGRCFVLHLDRSTSRDRAKEQRFSLKRALENIESC